ncbi:Ubiquitin-like-specific protease 1A [Platanthera zijinensis]|uniref:Ubiquitin-like-specific protease 1A n=1 Tax=Platanthera zijinensis TaxID=2320716 RepID=A0AAP0B341_9ASPA
MPVHTPSHWCLLVCNMKHCRWDFYDSLPHSRHRSSLSSLVGSFIEDADSALPPNMLDWKIEPVEGIPKQRNGTDCGMFVLKFMEAALSTSEITWEKNKDWQDEMPRFRAEIAAGFFRVFHELILSNVPGHNMNE